MNKLKLNLQHLNNVEDIHMFLMAKKRLYITFVYIVIFIISICLLIRTSPNILTSGVKTEKSDDNLNTSITIHFIKDSGDRATLPFQQYDLYRLNSYGIIPPPYCKITNTQNTQTIRFHLDKPSVFLLGFNEIYVYPTENIYLEYSILEKSKTTFKDSISIKKGKCLITYNQSKLYILFPDYAFNRLININELSTFLAPVWQQKLVLNAEKRYNLLYPNSDTSLNLRQFLEEYIREEFFINLINKLYNSAIPLNNNLKKYRDSVVINYSKNIASKAQYKDQDYKYWFSMKKLYEYAFYPLFKQNKFSLDKIKESLTGYDSVTQQYMLLQAIKSMISLNADSSNIAGLANNVSYPVFKTDLYKFLNKSTLGKLSKNDVDTAHFYDINFHIKTLSTIFKETTQPYLYIDFCGSWCAPCIQEIQEYSKSKRIYDTSNRLRPLWFFFENNNKDWLKIIEKYSLPRKDCFLVKDNQLIQNSFSKLFFWGQEFPHHFIFNQNGIIFDAYAVSLLQLKLDSINKSEELKRPQLPPS
ncbi:MAG: hypothetical protein PW786_12845 [Arachidicoccus sp.]|nr:hypothetical protein [Arachidicoccus sp.]